LFKRVFQRSLIDYIHRYAPHAEILIYETWAYPDDYYPKFGVTNLDQKTMYAGLKAAYKHLSDHTGLRIIPVGDAFQAARALPEPITLNVKGDKHANVNGQYLAAAVFYEMIFKENVEAVESVPQKVSAEDAKILRRVAHETVSKKYGEQIQSPAHLPVRQVECFDFDWKYHEGDVTNAQAPGFDDSGWKPVQLPHDAAIGRPPANRTDKGSLWNGFFPRAIGWYRKGFTVAKPLDGDRLMIEFGGVYRDAEVWLNGDYLGRWLNGYLNFGVDLTERVKVGENVLAVRYDNTSTNSARWYTGEGIYRNVWLERMAAVHVERDGQSICASDIGNDSAEVAIETEVRSHLNWTTNAEVLVEILSPEGQMIATRRGVAPISRDGLQSVRQEVSVREPELWDIENPRLYTARTTVSVGGQVMDQTEENFGIRKIRFSPEHGLQLNGKKLFLKGVNLHDDLAGVGTAAFDRAIERRLEAMKSLGVNAVRLSHNPHARNFLDLCDRLGMLVFDEAYDKWTDQYYGPGGDFQSHWRDDIKALIRRDRNHPSVFIWSVGNEPTVQQLEGKDNYGVKLLSAMVPFVKDMDPSRPVTAALYPARRNGVKWNDKGYDHAPPHQLAFLQDVVSVNYQSGFFARDREEYPQMMWLLSEAATANWGDVFFNYDHEPIMGQFYWGGTDYLGECKKWPQRGWCQGVIEMTDFFKPSSYYIQSFYSANPMIHIAVFNVTNKSSEVWNDVPLDWQPMYDHWNFNEGETLNVATFSNAEEVELILNGRSLGIKRMADCPKQKMIWKVPCGPGELKAIARNGGKIVTEHSIQTAGAPKKIQLEPDRTIIKANGLDLAFVKFKVVDGNGTQCPVNAPVIRFKVTGEGTNAGLANGNMFSEESYQGDQRSPWFGAGLLVVRSTRYSGNISISAQGTGLEPQTILIRSEE
jgi:beta-galactosidase